MPFLSVVTACYNEEENVAEVSTGRCAMWSRACHRGTASPYTYEHIFIDNASTDRTVEILRGICATDKRVKVIVNTRNFGHIRSPFHGLLQARGDAVISIVADLQDPPEMIRDFVARWEEGYKVVVGVKQESQEKPSMFFVRRLFYRLIDRLSEVPLVRNFTGFGLYDRERHGQAAGDRRPVPVLPRADLRPGLRARGDPVHAACPPRGITKNNFYTLYDMAMLGITNHSQGPAAAGHHGRIRLSCRPSRRARVPRPQARVVGHVRARPGAARDRRLLLRERATVLHRHPRRVHRVDPHPGLSSPAGDREGAHQLRLTFGPVRSVGARRTRAWLTSLRGARRSLVNGYDVVCCRRAAWRSLPVFRPRRSS